jgi:hypothetical protein
MEAGPSKEELDILNGEIYNLKVIYTLPQQIDKELNAILLREEQQRELKGATDARSGV